MYMYTFVYVYLCVYMCVCMYVHDADDALTRMCASATRSLRSAIDGTCTGVVCRYVLRPSRACVRARLGAHVSAPKYASAFRRRGPRVARLAGVQRGVCVQGGHRRVEHRACNHVGPCMRRLFDPGGAPPQPDAPGGTSMRRRPLCAAAPPKRARVCVRRRVRARMRGRARV